ncbi:MAG: hypothetical protein M1839_004873 [Geoglossum umbratile]|nr:MAG: hypothetical protein M1839_004873 [Geoglossum umbratile]
MEILATIGLVGNIVQFVDFGSKLISKSVQLYKSNDGTLQENIDAETATNDLVLLNNKLKSSANTAGDAALEKLCISCNDVAVELLEALDKLKVQGKRERWKSMRKAIRSVWDKAHIQQIEGRLAGFKEELNLHIIVNLREQICQLRLEGSDLFKGLDATTRNILDAIESRQDFFNIALHTQTGLIRTQIVDEHGTTRAKITQEIESLKLDVNLAGQEQRLAELHANGAAFNSRLWEHEPRCLPETRVDLIQQVMTWSEDPNGPCIFWLNGMAGTGKSTIARTVARIFADQNRLGASFIFSRGRRDLDHAGKFFTTLAAQLSHTLPALKPYVCKAMAENLNISQQGLGEQWKHLIFQPLSNLQRASLQSQTFVVVVDALDECDGENDVQLILRLLSQTKSLKIVRLRVFITSRPETPIRFGFLDIPKAIHRDFLLHDVSAPIIERDISIFFYCELEITRKRWKLPEQWPGEHKIKLLVQKAGGLFIYAATTCRYIQHRKDHPERRLALILEGDIPGQSPTGQLDTMYTQVLRGSVIGDCEGQERAYLLERFRQIVGSIVILFDPLTANALAKLLHLEDWMVEVTLDSLRSISDFSDDQDSPIRLLHPSFRDFLLDKQRCSDAQFLIDRKEAHNNLFVNSLEFMSKNLRRDMCNLRLPGTFVTEVEKSKLEEYLPRDVQYACRYWVYHLQRGDINLYDNCRVHIFLQKHFLHWLETLSLMGNMSDGVVMVRTLESMLASKSKVEHTSNADLLLATVYDAKRFILNNRSIIEKAPLQTYSSALVFSPKKSVIRTQFSTQFPVWIKGLPVVEEGWNPSLQTLEGHSGWVNSVVFSPDGKWLATGSEDETVKLWDAETGTLQSTLEGGLGRVWSVTFSPDGKWLAAGSEDETVKLWDAETGALQSTLEGCSGQVWSVAFSPEGKRLVSGSDTVKIWDAETGVLQSTLEGCSGQIWSVAFSPDGKRLASGSDTVNLWDAKTGTLQSRSDAYPGRVWSVVFSPDGKWLASGSNTVELWDAETGVLQSTLGGLDWARSMAFSPDGKRLASGSYDNTVKLWDTEAGSLQSVKDYM